MKNKLLYFILADENLFHPHYFSGVINSLPEGWKIVGVTVLKEKYRKGFFFYLYRQFSLWGFLGFFFLTVATVLNIILDKLKLSNGSSIQRVASLKNIPYLKITDVNDAGHISYLRNLHPDIIVSSCGQIFKTEILKLARFACINRHTGLLPKYGGSLPVFWAMYNHEKQFGVSIHLMVEKIDEGDVVSQIRLRNNLNSTLFSNYILGFKQSVPATITALENVIHRKIIKRFDAKQKLYFRFPEIEVMQDFRKNHRTFSLSDVSGLFYAVFR